MDRHVKKNYYILLFDAVAYYVFFTLWDVNSVIPVFLDKLGSPSWAIGAANSIKQLGFILPQLLIAAHVSGIKRLVSFVRRVLFIDRPQLLIFLALLLFLKPGKPVMAAFFISFAFFTFAEGLTLLPWMDLFGRTVRADLRGKFYGTVQVASSLLAAALGYLVSGLIESTRFPFPDNFAIIFGIGAIVVLPSLVFFKYAEDPPYIETSARPGWKTLASRCLKDKPFILMLAVQVLISADALALPYYIIMVRHKFPWLVPETGTYIFLSIVGGVLGGLLWGYLSDKKGNRTTIIIIGLFNILTSGTFLITQFIQAKPVLAAMLYPGFILAGIVAGGWLGFVNYMLDLATDETRPFYIAIDNAVLIPVALLPILGGFIRESAGDVLLYGITTACMIAGTILSIGLKQFRKTKITL